MAKCQLNNLLPGEKVEFVIRRHWIVFVMIALYAVGGVFLTILLYWILGFSVFAHLLNTVFWMYYLMFLYVNWLNYELDLIVVTDSRLIAVEQKSFLNRAVGETYLDKVQEVSFQLKCLLATLFDYGPILPKTAGSTSRFDMTFSPKPMENARKLNNVIDAYKVRRGIKLERQDGF
ncbi:hypothetical protein LAT59_02600 [Candidatus Gracilibacteria bacterium]|nr:hypothetical protein [Candidatus Gracilibacteria bacterium]